MEEWMMQVLARMKPAVRGADSSIKSLAKVIPKIHKSFGVVRKQQLARATSMEE